MKTRILISSIAILLSTASCTKNYFNEPNPEDSPTPTPTPLPVIHSIEYRVLGSVENAFIKAYSPNNDGTLLANSLPPWTVTYTTRADSVFLFISATSFDAGFLQVQIWIDDEFVRESIATSEFADPFGEGITATISGTFDLTGE